MRVSKVKECLGDCMQNLVVTGELGGGNGRAVKTGGGKKLLWINQKEARTKKGPVMADFINVGNKKALRGEMEKRKTLVGKLKKGEEVSAGWKSACEWANGGIRYPSNENGESKGKESWGEG